MRVLILVELFVFVGFVVGNNLFRRFRGKNLRGDFPVHPIFFVAGKLCMGVSWVFLLVQATEIPFTIFPKYTALEYAAAALLFLGIAFVIPAFLHLGDESKFGISDESVGLRATGIYRISRNPMYLGFYLVTLASLVLVPHPINIVCGLVGIYAHHRIVLAEERFLQRKHGASYEVYKREVRRYL